MTSNWNPRGESWGVRRLAFPAGTEAAPAIGPVWMPDLHIRHSFQVEEVAVAESAGRVTAEDVRATLDVPRWPLSKVRGHALSAAETKLASAKKTVQLKEDWTWACPMDQMTNAINIPIGGSVSVDPYVLMPNGADAVLPQDSEHYEGDSVVARYEKRISKPVAAGANVIAPQDDLVAGDPLVKEGRRLKPGDVAALTMAGVRRLQVFRRPRIALVTLHRQLTDGPLDSREPWLPDSVTPLVQALLARWGVQVDAVSSTRSSFSLPLWGPPMSAEATAAYSQYDLTIYVGLLRKSDYQAVRPSTNDEIRRIGDELIEPSFYTFGRAPYRPATIVHYSEGPPVYRGGPHGLIVALGQLPLPVLTSMYLVVRPLIDALSGVDAGLRLNRTDHKDWHSQSAQRASELQTQGVRWLDGVLGAPAPRDTERHWLQLAHFDHSVPGQVRLVVLPSEEHQVSGLLKAEAMVAIEKGSGEMPAGAPVQFFLLD